ncbi:MAG: HEAT repeat domain-containing protein [Acidobacteriaceae bacterium]|nr:HEAT repeat domain-containing protein [Acidobacteriaceae bacterium]
MICKGILFLALAGSALAQDLSGLMAESFQAHQSSDPDYQNGLRQLDARQWDQAISSFDAAASRKGSAADAALYWKAYAENKAGRREEALDTVAELRDEYPSSRWIKDAKALEVEVRAQAGAPVNPSSEPDEDLKLIALNSLMQSDPNQALPILQKLLASNNSPKVKDRALFVLTQSGSPEASKILSQVARGSSYPDLQLKAIRYMGMMGSDESRKELASIYSSSSDEHVKRAILQGFMMSGSRSFLLNAAKTEKDPALRRDAIHNLAMSGGQDELWQLYQSSASPDDKKEILQSMFLGGNSSRLVEIARSEKDPALRVAAIKSLGLMGSNGRGDVLVSIYQSDSNTDVRKAVLNSLFLQQNGKALVELARAEKDPHMKEEIVQKMALVHTKETTEYMMEVLK